MKVYYEDKSIIVCEKPYGVSSQDGSGESMIKLLKSHTGCDVFCVHRLDIQTTGVMVYAKNKQSAASLSKEITEGGLIKKYLAVCHGACEELGTMQDLLFHNRIKNKTFVVDTKRKGAKDASLSYKTLKTTEVSDKALSLVEILLHTGRTHQIRVQFASRGHSLYGDGKYGARDNDKIALHSYKIEFSHPATKERLSFESKPSGGIWDTFSE